jgi:hypothetical protein
VLLNRYNELDTPNKDEYMKIGRITSLLSAVTFTIISLTALVGGAATKSESPPTLKINDEKALSLLKEMSATLAEANSLSFTVRGLVPFASPTGQFISLFAEVHTVMQRPAGLFVQTRGDLFPRDLYFDGKTVTVIGGQKKFYAQKQAEASTVDEVIRNVQPGGSVLEMFKEILVSDPYSALTANLTSGFFVGQSIIKDHITDHLAFTGEGVDWEIWINTETRLPMLVVVSYREGERQPTFTVEFDDWKLNESISPETFQASIPKDAVKIEFKP